MPVQDQQQTINDLRAMLDWLEENPEIKLPHGITSFPIWFWSDKEGFLQTVRAFGDCEKSTKGEKFVVTKHFGSVSLVADIHRDEVCTKRTVLKTVPVDEWVCVPLLQEAEISEAMKA